MNSTGQGMNTLNSHLANLNNHSNSEKEKTIKNNLLKSRSNSLSNMKSVGDDIHGFPAIMTLSY